MGFFRISQVEDKKWMAERLLDLPNWREVHSFDKKLAESYNAELDARLDEMAERAATLRFRRDGSWTNLRLLLDSQARARYELGHCHGGNVGIAPRLIDSHIPDSRRNPQALAALIAVAMLYVGLVIGSSMAGWGPLLYLLVAVVAVPVAVLAVAFAARPLIYWYTDKLIERWFHGVWGLISGARDYLELDRFEAIDILEQRWNTKNGRQLVDFLDRCIRRHDEDPAYLLSLVMALARLGYAAEYLTRRETLGYNMRSLRLISGSFDSWDELGQALDRSWRRHAERRDEPFELERVSQNMDYMRRHVWPHARFGLPFKRSA